MSEWVPHGVPQGAVCAAHVDRSAVATCRRCGTFVCTECLRETEFGTLCPACTPKVTRTPWEERSRIGFWKACIETTKGTLLTPGQFFRSEPVDMGYGSPILWALLCTVVGSFFSLVWGLAQTALGMSIAGSDPALGAMLGGQGENLVIQVVSFLLAPVITVVALFIWAGIVHLTLAVFGGAKRTYDTTFRTLAYCQTTALFNVVPIVGSVVAAIWNVVIQIIGLSAAHETSVGRAAAAILVPICVMVGCLVGIIVYLTASFAGTAPF